MGLRTTRKGSDRRDQGEPNLRGGGERIEIERKVEKA